MFFPFTGSGKVHYPYQLIQRYLACGVCIFSIVTILSTVVTAAADIGIQNQSATPSIYDGREYKGRNVFNRQYESLDSFSILDHTFRIFIYIFLSAVFAGLTLGVMTIDTFTLEIIAESGHMPDCKYAQTILPLRKDAHKTLCTLIISNMLCNVLVVQEFRKIIGDIQHSRNMDGPVNAADEYWSKLWEFTGSTFLVVITEILPMSICKSKYSLRVAAWGAIFVQFAMIFTYLVSMPLGKFLDWVVGGKERGQIFDRNELRRLMVIQYERKDSNKVGMSKSELDLLLSAMDFQESTVRDVMQPIESITSVHRDDVVTPDFVEQIWLSGRSRVPVMSAKDTFESVLVVKDLLTVNSDPAAGPIRVSEIIKEKNRSLARVEVSTTLPMMLKLFQDLKTHMAIVFSASESPSTEWALPSPEKDLHGAPESACHAHKVIGLVTMEDVVEKLLNAEIYDEYDRYDLADPSALNSQETPVSLSAVDGELLTPPSVPNKLPRVNFYSYFTHPESSVALTAAQVWAVAFFLQRSVTCFNTWDVAFIKILLDECPDQQLVPPSYMQLRDCHRTSGGDEEESVEGDEIARSSSNSLENIILSSGKINSLSNSNVFPLSTSHSHFTSLAEDEKFVLYRKGVCAKNFTLVLGGQVGLLVGGETFSTRIFSFSHIGEEALTSSSYIPDFSAVVLRPARIYQIPKDLYDKYLTHQFALWQKRLAASPNLLDSRSHFGLSSCPTSHLFLEAARKKGYESVPSSSFAENNLVSDQKVYGTFNK